MNFSVCQSGFLPGDSCSSQLLSIIHDIQKSFEESPSINVRGVFFYISMAFDKSCLKDLVSKLKSYGISGNFLKLIENYLTDRKQRVVLNDLTFS